MISLGNEDWSLFFEVELDEKNKELEKKIDKLTYTHINEFWNQYKDPIEFNAEHKIENTSIKMFTVKKAHYTLQTRNKSFIYKFRGISPPKNKHENEEDFLPIYYKISKSLLLKENITFKKLYHLETKVTSLKDYYLNLQKFLPVNSQDLPGFEHEKRINFKLTNEDLPFRNAKEYRGVKKKPQNYALKIKIGEITTHENLVSIFSERIIDHIKNYMEKPEEKKKGPKRK